VSEGQTSAADSKSWSRERLLARLYDWEHDSFQADVDFYVQLARRTGGPVLELACGSGRVLSGIGREGLSVVGVDRSEAMLERARTRLEGARNAATLVAADLHANLDGRVPDGPFPLILLALDAFGLVPEPGRQLKLLRALRRRLAEDGLLVLDLVHVAPLFDEPQDVLVFQQAGDDPETGSQVMKWMVRRLHPATQTLELLSIHDLSWPDGKTRRLTESLALRYFSRFEVEHLLAAAGLEVEAIYGDYELSDFADDSPRLLIMASANGASH
jgi:SAM-dependent methyltransferase